MSKVAIIDALAILFRSFYGINMYNSKGNHIGGAYGFLDHMLNIVESLAPDYIIVTLDSKEKTWRHHETESYKSNRKQTPPEIIPQFQLIKDICDGLGLKYYEGNGFEADDWIASCTNAYKSDHSIFIVSTDKDLLQLVSDNVLGYDPFRKLLINSNDVYLKWGVRPTQIADLLALVGDASDCVSGVKGIGRKTATAWLNQYNSLEEIIENIENLEPVSRRKALAENVATAVQSKRLVLLREDLPIDPLRKMVPCNEQLQKICNINEINLYKKAERILNKYFSIFDRQFSIASHFL